MIFLGSTPSLSFIPSPHPARQECSCYWTVSILSQLKCTKVIFETENPWKPVMSVDQDVYVSYYPSIEGDHQIHLISSSSAQCWQCHSLIVYVNIQPLIIIHWWYTPWLSVVEFHLLSAKHFMQLVVYRCVFTLCVTLLLISFIGDVFLTQMPVWEKV